MCGGGEEEEEETTSKKEKSEEEKEDRVPKKKRTKRASRRRSWSVGDVLRHDHFSRRRSVGRLLRRGQARRLLFAGCALMGLSLFALTIAFGAAGAGKWVVLSAMFVYIGGYQVGFGPISWLIIGEVFPCD